MPDARKGLIVTLPPANWYSDPWDPEMVRYWDGGAWTGHTQPVVVPVAPPPPQPLAPVSSAPSLVHDGPAAPVAPRAEQGFDAIGGRIVAPGFGHTMTPGVVPQPFTPSASPRKAPRRSAGRLVLTAVLAAALAVAGGMGVRYALTSVHGPRTEAGATPSHSVHWILPSTPAASTPASDVPTGWAMYTSRSGAVTYAHNPSWTDGYSIERERATYPNGSPPGGSLELGGFWTWGTPNSPSATVVQVMVVTHPGNTDGPRETAIGFATGASANAPGTGEVQTMNAAIAVSSRYDAWRIDSTFSTSDGPVYTSGIAFVDGDTAVIVYCMSRQPPTVWSDDVLALARSITIVGPAVPL